jgi:transposase
VTDVEHWAEIRRMHFVDGVSIRGIRRRTGLHRETIRRALAAKNPPAYRRPKAPSKLDPFKEEIERLLRSDHRMPGHSRTRADRRAGL